MVEVGRRHDCIQDADGKGSATGERLGEVELGVRVVVVVLVQELHVAVVHQLCDHWHVRPINRAFSVEDYGRAQWSEVVWSCCSFYEVVIVIIVIVSGIFFAEFEQCFELSE